MFELHNAQQLLFEYRPMIWRKSALETISSSSGQQVLQNCVEQIRFTQMLVEMLRSHNLLGEKLYQIIYASYMTERQPYDIEEILSNITKEYEYIPRSTYFRLKGRAIKMMDDSLKNMMGVGKAS